MRCVTKHAYPKNVRTDVLVLYVPPHFADIAQTTHIASHNVMRLVYKVLKEQLGGNCDDERRIVAAIAYVVVCGYDLLDPSD